MISDGVKGVARVSGCYDFHKGIVTAGDSGSCWGSPVERFRGPMLL